MSTVTPTTSAATGGIPSSLTNPASSVTATSAKEAGERFLKLLVTQLQNQDPMNPVDNAQMTSQMAQISTVSGIEKLNVTVEGLTSQFVQMQALQGASLVGKDVILKGDKLSSIDGKAVGAFELDAHLHHQPRRIPHRDAVLDPTGDHPDIAGLDGARLVADGEGEFALQAHADLLVRMAVWRDDRMGVQIHQRQQHLLAPEGAGQYTGQELFGRMG